MQNTTYWNSNHSISVEEILLGSLYSTIVLFGCIGNVMVIFVVWRNNFMHTSTNYLLSSLAGADLVSLLFCPGIYDYALSDVHPRGNLGDYICKFFTGNAVQAVSLNVSALSLTLVAVERYNALVHPMVTRTRFTKNNVRYAIVLTWILGILSCIPDFLNTSYSETLGKCSRPWTLDQAHKMRAHIITTNVFLIFIPLVIISYCYIQITKGIFFSKTIISKGTQSKEDKKIKKNLAKLLLSVTALFYACYLPFGIFMIYVACQPHDESTGQTRSGPFNTIHSVVRFLLFFNSFINPFLYAWQSSNYRNCFKRLFRCNVRQTAVNSSD